MKKQFYFMLALLAVLSSCGPTTVVVRNQTSPPEVSYQTFYDDLSPYGQWIEYPEYGYVWMPDVDPGFRPYATNGQWVYSDDGWVWSSGYDWGWATFHYGRWFYADGYGWMWVPGDEWAPAWVSWRSNNDYYGWAPLGPGVSISGSFSNYNPPYNYWCFVPRRYVASPSVKNYYVNETKNVTIINNTTIINNNVTNINYNGGSGNRQNNNRRSNYNNYAPGPDPNEVSRITGSRLRTVTINNSDKPGQQLSNDRFSLYRPGIAPPAGNANNSGNASRRVAPARVQSWENFRRSSSNNRPNEMTAPNNNNPAENRQFNRPANNNTPANNNPAGNQQNNRPNNNPANNNTPGNNNPAGNQQNNRPDNNPANNNAPVENRQFNRPNNNPANNAPANTNNPAGNQQNNRPNNNPANNNPAGNRPNNIPVNNNAPANSNARPNNNQPNNSPQRNNPVVQPNTRPNVPANNNIKKPQVPDKNDAKSIAPVKPPAQLNNKNFKGKDKVPAKMKELPKDKPKDDKNR